MHGISERSATPEQSIYANGRSIAFEMGQNCQNDDFFDMVPVLVQKVTEPSMRVVLHYPQEAPLVNV